MTLKMTSAQVVDETSVIVNNNSSFQNYTNPDDHTQQTTDTPGFKPFTIKNIGHHPRLGDIIGSNYPLNSCNCTFQGHVYSFSSRYVSQEREAQL